jgi:hypothetical protein
MSVNYYPTVQARIDYNSFDRAESVCDDLEAVENVETRNRESKFTRKEFNGETEVDGYIKLSLTIYGSVDVFVSYSSDEEDLTVTYESDMYEAPKEFRDVIDAFDAVVVPVLEDEYGADVVDYTVTTRMI